MISSVIDQVRQILIDTTLFADVGKQFTGIVQNFPAAWVMPVRTAFDAETQGFDHAAHQVQIKFAVSGSEPDAITGEAMTLMQAAHDAIEASVAAGQWNALRVFIAGHDYGPLFELRGVMARFPELELVVEVAE